MNTVLYIHKPKGMTSFDICRKLRKVFFTSKIGHTGTLDPNATGVMVILVGSAAKCSQYLSSDKKEYIATVRLGTETDTLDVDGNVIKEETPGAYDPEKLKKILESYKGEGIQIPPMTSAIKVAGKKLYQYQREGKEVEVSPRKITVYDIELLSHEDTSFVFRAEVSGGTYIRALMRDILRDLGEIGTLEDLVRTKIDDISLSDCDELSDVLEGRYHEHTPYELLSKRYECVEVENSEDVLHGKKIAFDAEEERILVVKGNTALAMYRKDDGIYRCERGLL